MGIFEKLLAMFMSLQTVLFSVIGPAAFVPAAETEPARVTEGAAITLAENGHSDYVIVCAKPEGDPERKAAERLQTYLEDIGGVLLPIVGDDTAPAAHEIVVGRTNRENAAFDLDRSAFTAETLCYFTCDERLVIAGGEQRGTLYAVYEFLKRELGCRWYTDEVTVIPHADAVRIPKELRFSYTPVLEYRNTDWISTNDAEFCLANHINAVSAVADAELGGAIRFTGGMGHTLTGTFVNAGKYFETNPEYFALYLGQRTPKQLCLSNPNVLALVISEVRALLEQNPDADIISLSQGDTILSYCQCRDCLAMDLKNGSHAGSMIRFVNSVAEVFADEYPNLMFDTFAYRYTRTAPMAVRPRENVIVRLCSIECCFAHPLNDRTDLLNAWFSRDLEKWSDICDNLYIWDYTTNYWQFLGPFPNFGVMQQNLQYFAEHHVRGVYEEGNYKASESDAEFAGLRCYLLSRLLFDPYCDYEAEMDGFLKAYYGAGWQYVKEYIRMTTEHTGTLGRHMIIYHDMIDSAVLDLNPAEIVYCDSLWQNAKALCANETETERVERSELSWRYWKACNLRGEFSRITNPTGWKAEQEKLLADYRRFGITQLTEVSKLAKDPNLNLPPSYWGDEPRIRF